MSKPAQWVFLSHIDFFFPNPSASLSYEVSDLQPFTVYELRSVATDGFGSTHSAWTPLMTAEDSK